MVIQEGLAGLPGGVCRKVGGGEGIGIGTQQLADRFEKAILFTATRHMLLGPGRTRATRSGTGGSAGTCELTTRPPRTDGSPSGG